MRTPHRPLFALLAALSACASEDAGRETSASTAAGSGSHAADSGARAAGPRSFTQLYANTFASCKVDFCHGSGRAGLDMSSRDAAYRTLVDRPSSPTAECATLGKKRVLPGDPDESLLYLKLDINAPCGQQMPPGGAVSDDARQLVRDWIAAGAPDD